MDGWWIMFGFIFAALIVNDGLKAIGNGLVRIAENIGAESEKQDSIKTTGSEKAEHG